jgi:CubicO group peptidase (beta-lactamase class C family)
MRRAVALLMFLSVSSPARAQTQPASGSIPADPEVSAALVVIEARLRNLLHDKGIPGMSAAVVYDQDILWAKGMGFADREKNAAASPQTVYRCASITKLFTATMLMQLRDAGKVALDDPVSKYVPEFRIRSRFADSPLVTLLQLATHTSGLPREAPLDYWRTLKFPPVDALIAAISASGDRVFPPYLEWKYSNVGYAILGKALSQAAGEPYFSYVKNHILEPLGMDSSGFVLSPDMQTRMATGYFPPRDGRPAQPAFQPDYGGYGPASSLYSSVADMAHFISLQFRDGVAQGSQILHGSTLREMHSAHWLNPDWQSGWGIGFQIQRIGDQTAIGHSGAVQGFTTNITVIPKLKIGVAIFTNTNTEPWDFAREALSTLIPAIQHAQERRRPEPPPPPAHWQKYAGIYRDPFGRSEVRIRHNQLELVSADDPEAKPIELAPEGENKFRMKGGPSSGELLVFELDSAGNVTGMWVGRFPMDRE